MEKWITKDTRKKEILELGKKCEQCGHCCTHTSGFILKQEVPKIAEYLKMDENEFIEKCLKTVVMFNTILFKPAIVNKKGKYYGNCIFYDKGCSIQDVKPLHCSVSNCNEHGDELNAWFVLNYLVDEDDAESLRQWNVYLKSGGKNIPGGSLAELVPDLRARKKILNYSVLR